MMTGIRSCNGAIASFAARVMMVNDSIVSLGGASSRSVSGVSLHSYRYAWAERALKCGFPERFAQQALGHNSKAVHRAYAKHAEVTVPSLADWEKDWQENPQRSVLPKLLPADFISAPSASSQRN